MEQQTANIIIIILLSILLIVSILGINIFQNVINGFIYVLQVIFIFLKNLMGDLSYSTGEIVNESADVAVDTSIFGIEIIDGMLYNIGNMFKGQATPVIVHDIDKQIHYSNTMRDDPQPNNNGNNKWCFVGIDDEQKNKCVKLNDNQQCKSEKVFNSLSDCNGYKIQ